MSVKMRAKFQVGEVARFQGTDRIRATPVCRSDKYPEDGSDEDNTYAKFSPSGSLELSINNPALIGKINPGDRFYLDFIPVEKPEPVKQG